MLVGHNRKARDIPPLGAKSEASLARAFWGKTSVGLRPVAISGYIWTLIRWPWGREAVGKSQTAPHLSHWTLPQSEYFART